MGKAEKTLIAKALFAQSGLNRKEIAKQVGISETTLRDWIKKGGWEDIRESRMITREHLLQESYAQLAATNKRITEEFGGVPNKELSDAKAVIRKEIESLSHQPLYRYVEVMEDFQGWITKNAPKELPNMTRLSMSFIEDVAAKKI